MSQRTRNLALQTELFPSQPDVIAMPEGFATRAGVIDPADEQHYAARFAELPFAPFEFHGFLGKRRIVSFGWRYDYAGQRLQESAKLPDFLEPLRALAGDIAGCPAERFQQALVTEYAPGAGIGWHRDKPMFEEVVAFSFLAPCTLRFRLKQGAAQGRAIWDRAAMEIAPRSAYHLKGPARLQWEHSVPALEALRYAVTFRSFWPEREPR